MYAELIELDYCEFSDLLLERNTISKQLSFDMSKTRSPWLV